MRLWGCCCRWLANLVLPAGASPPRRASGGSGARARRAGGQDRRDRGSDRGRGGLDGQAAAVPRARDPSAAFVLAVLAVVTGLVDAVTGSAYSGLLGLAAGAVLACRAGWRCGAGTCARSSRASPSGAALGVTAGARRPLPRPRPGRHRRPRPGRQGAHHPGPAPQVVRRDPGSRETAPLVDVPASLLAAAALIVVAYLASGTGHRAGPRTAARLAPLGVATVLIGFFVLVTRRKAVSAITGLLLVDNGVALTTFLLTAGVPLLVELGASLDVLLVVVVLRVLATTMRARPRPLRPRPAPGAARLMLIYAILAVPAAAGGRSPPPCRGGAGPAGRRPPPTGPSWSWASCSPSRPPAVSRPAAAGGILRADALSPRSWSSSSARSPSSPPASRSAT